VCGGGCCISRVCFSLSFYAGVHVCGSVSVGVWGEGGGGAHWYIIYDDMRRSLLTDLSLNQWHTAHTYTHTHTPPRTLSLSHTHTNTHKHTQTQTHTLPHTRIHAWFAEHSKVVLLLVFTYKHTHTAHTHTHSHTHARTGSLPSTRRSSSSLFEHIDKGGLTSTPM